MVGDWSQWDIPDYSRRLDRMNEEVIPIIRSGTRSHRLQLLDCVLGHSEAILILIPYSFKILVIVILPSGSPAWITNSTLAPHLLAVYKRSLWQVVFFRWLTDRWMLMMEMNWPQHKWRIHLHCSGLLMMTLTTCCAWQVHKQLWFHVQCLQHVWSDCWLCACPAYGMSWLLLDGFLWNLVLGWLLKVVEKIHIWWNSDESNRHCQLDAIAAQTCHARTISCCWSLCCLVLYLAMQLFCTIV